MRSPFQRARISSAVPHERVSVVRPEKETAKFQIGRPLERKEYVGKNPHPSIDKENRDSSAIHLEVSLMDRIVDEFDVGRLDRRPGCSS